MASNNRNIRYKCPFCNNKFTREDLVNHIEDDHPYDIPADFTPFRYVFNYVNKKPLTYHGKCTECGGPTEWDENKGRYNRQCNNKACHDSYVKKFEANMMKTRGVTRISATASGQLKMLSNRKISGKYKFSNGEEKTYTGSYELKALEFMDKVMHIDPNDLMCPGPILEYSLDGNTHIYITDFYYQPYNLIIEVKDGGDNPNKRNMPDYRAKQIAKEKYIIKHTNYNYLRLTNNNLNQLLAVFANLKMQMVENTGERVIHVNEAAETPIGEMMNALMSGKVVGLKDSEAYITNNLQNNVFSGGIAIMDGRLDSIFGINKEGVLVRLGEEESKSIIDNTKTFYKLGDRKEVSKKLKPVVGTKITEEELYETLTGIKLYDKNQIEYNLESVNIPDFNTSVLEKYVFRDTNIDLLIESINEVVKNG